MRQFEKVREWRGEWERGGGLEPKPPFIVELFRSLVCGGSLWSDRL